MENVVDIVKIAIEKEVRARIFYDKASEITRDGESQMVFLELVEMEDGHARRLTGRFGDLLGQQGTDAEVFLRETERALEAGLSVEETELIKNGDLRAVIEFAIGREADARDGYLALADRLQAEDDRAFCEGLAAEEQQHFDTLAKLRISVDTPIDERPAL